MTRRSLAIPGTVAIPVGHRVAVIILCRDAAVFGRDMKPVPHEPLLVDLTTGIYYGFEWQLASEVRDLRLVFSPEPAPNAEIAERFTGVVASCMVVATQASGSSRTYSTTLELDVEP